jgi:hypothetical protein
LELYKQQVEAEQQLHINKSVCFLKKQTKELVMEKRRLCAHFFEELDSPFCICSLCCQIQSRFLARAPNHCCASSPSGFSHCMSAKRNTQPKLVWDQFQREHKGSMQEGLHQNNSVVESTRFCSALSLLAAGMTAEPATATLLVSTGIAYYPQSSAAQADE